MLFSSLDTLLKVSKTTSPKKTIRKWLRNAVGLWWSRLAAFLILFFRLKNVAESKGSFMTFILTKNDTMLGVEKAWSYKNIWQVIQIVIVEGETLFRKS